MITFHFRCQKPVRPNLSEYGSDKLSGATKSFKAASTPQPDGDDFRIVYESNWVQGRGIYGGLIFATLIRALEHSALFEVRNLSVELAAPVLPDKECLIQCMLMRRGALTAFYSFRIYQDNEVCVFGSAMTGADRKTTTHNTFIDPPSMRPYDSQAAIQSALMPPFSHQLEYKMAHGHPPFSGQKPHSGGWISFRNPGSQHDKAMSVALSDAWWPSYMSQINQLRAMGTVSFCAHFVEDPNHFEANPVQLICETSHSTEGYLSERNRLWGPNGRLLVDAVQRIAVIR